MNRPRIADARLVPVVATDAAVPAVPADRLTASALRSRFARSVVWQPESVGDGMDWSERPPAAAAVLVPLVVRDAGLQVLLTRRSEHLRDHAGQISFPGGRCESEDTDAADTAMREAEEEVGLQRGQVEVLGQLPAYATVTGFVVTPVVALVRTPLLLRLDSSEVAEAFEVPLQFLMTPANHRRHLFSADGIERKFLSMPWTDIGADGLPREHFIWGATAAILRNLYGYLAT